MKCGIGYCADKLNKRIVIESKTQTPDDYGGNTVAWATFATVWAQIKPIKWLERFHSEKLENEVTHKIVIRYKTGIKANMRILYDSRYFQITGITDIDEAKRYIEILAQELRDGEF
jgi:SPP1 family predicted phage head-tail adaptor